MAFGVRKREKETDNPTPTRTFSKKQEDSVAKAIGGVRTPNSGATDWIKGDVTTKHFLLECKTKTTHSESISIKKDWIMKNRMESAFMGKPHQAIVFNFGPDEENFYIIDESLMQYLVEKLNEDTEW